MTTNRDALREALEMIAGYKQCPDPLMSNQDIARVALSQPLPEAAKPEPQAQAGEPRPINWVDYARVAEAIAQHRAALEECVGGLELGRDYVNEARDEHARAFGDHPATQAALDLIDAHRKQIDAAITHANQVLGRKEFEV